jgi:hypothetical protein
MAAETFTCKHCGSVLPIPEHELKAAQHRNRQLDELADLCAWNKFSFQINDWERRAREQWHRIMNLQGEFEKKYNL